MSSRGASTVLTMRKRRGYIGATVVCLASCAGRSRRFAGGRGEAKRFPVENRDLSAGICGTNSALLGLPARLMTSDFLPPLPQRTSPEVQVSSVPSFAGCLNFPSSREIPVVRNPS